MSLRPMSWQMDMDSELLGLIQDVMQATTMNVDEALESVIESAREQARELKDDL